MTQEIKFGTDGWRGLIADDFTFDNVRRVAGAIAGYVLKNEEPQRGVIVGYDARFASPRAAQIVAEVLAEAGIPVKLAERLHAHSRRFVCGEASGRGRRRDGHLQPQSLELERSEVQRQLRRLGDAGDHEEDRRRTCRRSRAERNEGDDRRSRSEEGIRESRLRLRRHGPHRENKIQVRRRRDVRLRPRRSDRNLRRTRSATV